MATGFVFVTVGTTKFDKLVETVTDSSVLKVLKNKGYKKVIVQFGHGKFSSPDNLELPIESFPFKNSLEEDIRIADLIISHAGAGSSLEVLRAAKPLIVVVNEDLMDNHQFELAEALQSRSYALSCTANNLLETIEKMDTMKIKPYPPPDSLAFIKFLNKTMEINE